VQSGAKSSVDIGKGPRLPPRRRGAPVPERIAVARKWRDNRRDDKPEDLCRSRGLVRSGNLGGSRRRRRPAIPAAPPYNRKGCTRRLSPLAPVLRGEGL